MIVYTTLLLALAAVFSTHAIAQPLSHAFTYQGQLTRADQSLDSIVDFKFRLYDAQSAGTQIGTEQFVLNHSVNAGLFSVLLDFGSTAFSDQQRWLEIDVKALGDIEYTTLSPRQLISVAPVASVSIKPWTITTQGIHYADGQVAIGNTNPQSPLHITNGALDDDVSVLFNDDVIIEDTDAILTLMSDDSGSAGSGIMFKEIPPSGLLSNQWGLYRGTSGINSPLRWSFGTSSNYTLNPTIFSFSTDGVITTPPRTRTKYLLAANANNIGNSKISIGLNSFAYTLQSDSNSNAIASLPIDLPIGVEITELSAGVSDFSQNSSVSVVLMEHAFGTTTALEVYSLETTLADSSGHRVLNSTLSTPITIQEGMTYYLEIRLLGSLTNFAEFIDAKISYTTDQLD